MTSLAVSLLAVGLIASQVTALMLQRRIKTMEERFTSTLKALSVFMRAQVTVNEVLSTTASGDLAERCRRLASLREDLVAAGVDPDDLEIPVYPDEISGDHRD